MSFLRRTTTSLTESIRQITSTKPVKETAIRAATIGAMPHVLNNVLSAKKTGAKNEDVGRSIVSHLSQIRKVNPQTMLPNNTQTSFNLTGAKCVLTSNTARVSKLFASFDLSSMSISFVGMMGDFAVWAITDPSTGELVYLIDDNW